MKNIIYKLISFSFLLCMISSCKKGYLDSDPTQYISNKNLAEAAKTDPGLLNGNIAGLYATMYNTGTGGTDLDHDDFGQKGYDIYSDMVCSDLVLGGVNYGWYSDIAQYRSQIDYTNIDNYKPWRYYYRIIFGANTVLDALGGEDAEPEGDEERHVMGQAKAMRAYAYFYLSQLFSKEGYNAETPILPIYHNTEVPNQPLSTTSDVFDFIIADLTDAITYLEDFERTGKEQVNKYVAEGLLAYVYAARGTEDDLREVLTLTNDIIQNGGYPLTTRGETVAVLSGTTLTNPESGFNNIATPSWMWGVDLTLANGLDLVSWWGQVDVYTYSYAWAGDPKVINIDLYNSIRADDIRKNQFVLRGGADRRVPSDKFFAPGRTIAGQRYITTDYVYMRVDEMYLLNAEANAKLGNTADARTSLKDVLELRLDDVNYINTLAGQALEDEIYLQTRIELWGEGKSYLAMKRNKATITIPSNSLFLAGTSMPYNDNRLYFKIPQAEVLNNPALTSSSQ